MRVSNRRIKTAMVLVLMFHCFALWSQNNEPARKKEATITIGDLPESEALHVITSKEANSLSMKASRYMGENDFNSAIEIYKKLAAAMNENAEYQCYLAIAYDSAKNFTEAIKYYQKSLQIDPKYSPAYFGLGKLYYEKMDEPDEAINFLTMAEDNAKENDKLRLFLYQADINEQLGNTETSRGYYKKAKAFKPELMDIVAKFGDFEFRHKNYEQALALYLEAKNRFPYNGKFYIGVAKAYEALGNISEATTQYEWVLENIAEYYKAEVSYHYAMFLLRQTPDETFAIEMYLINELSNEKPHPDAWRQYAKIASKNGEYAVLLETLERMADKYSDLGEFNYYMGKSYFETGNKTQAKIYLSIAAKKGDDNAKKMLDENF